ncbi:MAG: Uma2 family endonuclease [Luteitalea sp.]|nr:Uma2 family endonuclease [Luteitalea sp.]
MSRMTVEEYLARPEAVRRQELAYGMVREPAALSYDHQSTVRRFRVLLDRHVRRLGLGRVCVSAVDVVLDRERALVVQPDIVFISHERESMATDRVCGAPDLVVEVLSAGSERHDRVTRLAWYRKYGVRECWFVDLLGRTVEVLDLSRGQEDGARTLYGGAVPICSHVLGPFAVRTERLFK